MLTWIYEFRPDNKSIYAFFDEESEFSGPRTPKVRLDWVLQGKCTLYVLKQILFNLFLLLLISLRSNFNSRGVNSRELF